MLIVICIGSSSSFDVVQLWPSFLILLALHMICSLGAQEFTVVFFLLLSRAGQELSSEFQVAMQIHIFGVPMATHMLHVWNIYLHLA